MGRIADLAVVSAVVLLCACSCDAALRSPTRYAEECVSAKTSSRRNQGEHAKVATCSRAQELEASTRDLQDQFDSLANETKETLDEQEDQIQDLRDDVDALQGKTTESSRVITFRVEDPEDIRIFCEVYTYSEAMEVARLAFGRSNPNLHFVHVPCAPDCPDSFFKIRQDCYRPNDPPVWEFLSPLFGCLYDPVPLNETCTRVLYIGVDGYFSALGDDWHMMDGNMTGA